MGEVRERHFTMSVSLRQRIKKHSMAQAGHLAVKDVRIGLTYTAVMLEDGSVGVAYSFLKRGVRGCKVFRQLSPLAGRRATELLALFDSKNTLESAVALATSNAITNRPEKGYLVGDVLSYIQFDPSDRVAMVGHFAPLVPLIKKRVSELRIFEETSRASGELLPASQAGSWLPKCQVALITATSIINNTTDALLEAAAHCREIAILGASTPMLPEAFDDMPVTLLSGVVVTHPGDMLRIVSEGGGTRLFRGCTQKVNLRL